MSSMKEKSPFFSIVIPTFNRPLQLADCLASITRLDYPRASFEVIVVDDGSHPPLDDVVEPFRKKIGITLKTQRNAGPATARNTGVAAAGGEFLTFIDDDNTVEPDWLKRLSESVRANPNSMIGGRIVNIATENLYSSASQLLIDYLHENDNGNPEESRFFTGNNQTMPKNLFNEIGGYDVSYRPGMAAEDREFCERWLRLGHRMIHTPEVKVMHAHRMTLGSYWRQQFAYGRGAYRFHSQRSVDEGEKSEKEPIGFYSKLLLYPFTVLKGRSAFTIFVLFVLSQAATVAGFYRERLYGTEKSGDRLG